MDYPQQTKLTKGTYISSRLPMMKVIKVMAFKLYTSGL